MSQNDFCNFKHARLNNSVLRDVVMHHTDPPSGMKEFFPHVLGMLAANIPPL